MDRHKAESDVFEHPINDIVEVVELLFLPFLHDYGFTLVQARGSTAYGIATFKSDALTLYVECDFTNVSRCGCDVMICRNEATGLASIDDRSISPRMSDLNNAFASRVSPEARAENIEFFAQLSPELTANRSLEKVARELRLVLPLYLEDLRSKDNE